MSLPAKYSKFTAFAFWYIQRLVTDDIMDESKREQAFANLKLLDSVDEQVPIYEDFVQNSKEIAKNMKSYISSITKPAKTTKKNKKVAKKDENNIVNDVLESLKEPRTDEAPEPAPKKRGGGRKKKDVVVEEPIVSTEENEEVTTQVKKPRAKKTTEKAEENVKVITINGNPCYSNNGPVVKPRAITPKLPRATKKTKEPVDEPVDEPVEEVKKPRAITPKLPRATKKTNKPVEEEKPKKTKKGKEQLSEPVELHDQPADVEYTLEDGNNEVVSLDIEAETIEYEGKEYLKDVDDNVYSMDSVLVGKIKDDNVEFF